MTDAESEIAQELERWTTDTSDSAAWDARRLVDRLSKSGDNANAIDFGEQAIAQWPDFDPLRSAIAWAYYRRDIHGADTENPSSATRQRAKDALERIRILTSKEPYGTYSALPFATLQVAKIAIARWPQNALSLLEDLDPSQLDREPRGEYPSIVAQWYLATTKALRELELWSDLLSRCDAALASTGLREADRPLIRYRRALAFQHTGRADEALVILQDLRRELPEWWVEAALAQALCTVGDRKAAVEACRRALDTPGKVAFRWRTVMLLGELLDDDADLACKHVQLARALRVDEGWPPDKDLEQLAASLGVTEPPLKPNVAELKQGWRTMPDAPRVSGVVKTVLPGDRSGFITVHGEAADVYFAMERNSTEDAPRPGTAVTFRLVDGFDKKKNQPSRKAVDVRPTNKSA